MSYLIFIIYILIDICLKIGAAVEIVTLEAVS